MLGHRLKGVVHRVALSTALGSGVNFLFQCLAGSFALIASLSQWRIRITSASFRSKDGVDIAESVGERRAGRDSQQRQ
jgi:hypothetical protein